MEAQRSFSIDTVVRRKSFSKGIWVHIKGEERGGRYIYRERSRCQSRCVPIKGILCLGGVEVRAERQGCRLALHGQSFPNKGDQRRRRGEGGPEQRCPLSSDTCCWRAADIEDSVWLCPCTSARAWLRTNEWETERERGGGILDWPTLFCWCGAAGRSPLKSVHLWLRTKKTLHIGRSHAARVSLTSLHLFYAWSHSLHTHARLSVNVRNLFCWMLHLGWPRKAVEPFYCTFWCWLALQKSLMFTSEDREETTRSQLHGVYLFFYKHDFAIYACWLASTQEFFLCLIKQNMWKQIISFVSYLAAFHFIHSHKCCCQNHTTPSDYITVLLLFRYALLNVIIALGLVVLQHIFCG